MKRAVIFLVAAAIMTAGCLKPAGAERLDVLAMNPGSEVIGVESSCSGDFKVLIYGNSIALHLPKPDIGWTNHWGMAASAAEKDFAHLVVAGLEAKLGKTADFRIRNLASLERNFTTNVATVAEISDDAEWGPDFVVIALGENVVLSNDGDAAGYQSFLADLAKVFFARSKRPKLVMRAPFWKDPVKAECTFRAAKAVGAVYADAGSLGEDERNRAIGLFKHDGVAAHPGDLGMRRLADMILAAFGAK